MKTSMDKLKEVDSL